MESEQKDRYTQIRTKGVYCNKNIYNNKPSKNNFDNPWMHLQYGRTNREVNIILICDIIRLKLFNQRKIDKCECGIMCSKIS